MSENNWREKEPSLEQVLDKYHGEINKFTAIKIDVDRRGFTYSEEAAKLVDPDKHHVEPKDYMTADGKQFAFPIGLTLRDGTTICGGPSLTTQNKNRDPYVIDAENGILYITDNGEKIEEVEFWEKPDFYDKVTSNGTPMWEIATARPQRLTITPGVKCHFWDTPGEGCKFCGMFAGHRTDEGEFRDEKFFQDVTETVAEALKQKGRYASYHMTSGSTLSGCEIFEDEVDLYIKTLQAAGKAIHSDKFPTKLVASGFSKRQLERLRDETGMTGYVTDLEVLNKDLFQWICPGKARLVGYEEWKHRLYEAVDVFGRGQVHCGIVGGIETAQPNGFRDEDEALKAVLTEADEIASHGVSFAECIWNTIPKSYFAKQNTPTLDYYVRLALGLSGIRKKYGLPVYIDDYRRCGNHPNTDLARIEKW
jgi:hypothetical protein